jgi:deoxyribonuclease I
MSMPYLISVAFLLFSSITLAAVDQRVGSNELAYYGADFYQALRSAKVVPKPNLHRILSGVHASNPGKHDSINTGHCTKDCYRHTSVSYDEARKIVFGELDVEKDNRGHYVKDVYCGKKFHFRSVDEIRRRHTEVNIEHTWPQSKFTNRFDKGQQKTDLHHLFPTDSDANSRRANHDFGNVENAPNELNVHNCEVSKLAVIKGEVLFMPPKDHRGNVARALFYFAVRYDMELDAEDEKVLREWHRQDPVDHDEVERHEIIAQYQKVRNPFIDHPELVSKVTNF